MAQIKILDPNHVEIDGQMAGKVVDAMVNHKHLASDIQRAFEVWHEQSQQNQAKLQEQVEEHKAALTQQFKDAHLKQVNELRQQAADVREEANQRILEIQQSHAQALKDQEKVYVDHHTAIVKEHREQLVKLQEAHTLKDQKIQELESHVKQLGGRKLALQKQQKALAEAHERVSKELANAR